MEKLIELSVRGETFYFLNVLNKKQLSMLQKFAATFYTSAFSDSSESDEAIVAYFVSAVQRRFHIVLNHIAVATVLVIK